MSAEDVRGWLGELLQISRVSKRSDEEFERGKEICRGLRSVGYTIQWIEDFTEGRIWSGTIKRWTRGMEVKDTSGRDKLMEELRVFVESGHSVSDLDEYAEAKKTLESVPISFTKCVGLASNLLQLDTDFEGLLKLSGELADTKLNAKGILRTNELRRSLDAKGLTADVEDTLLRAADRHGSGEEVLEIIAAGESLREVVEQVFARKKAYDEFSEKIVSQRSELNNLVDQTRSYLGYVEVAKTLLGFGFDVNACNELKKASEKYGSAPGVIGAINTHNSVKEMEAEAEVKKSEYESWEKGVQRLKSENKALGEQCAEANQLLGQIDEKYRSSRYLQDIARIVAEP